MVTAIHTRFALLMVIMPLLQGRALADPRVLLHHSFDQTLDTPDYAAGSVSIDAGKELALREPAIRGKAAWFAESAVEATLRIELGHLLDRDAWTISLWEILEVKEWLTAPEDNLITLLDAEDRPIVKLSKSGGIFVYEGDKVTHLECFDALYWVRGNHEHLALTWDATGSGVPRPKGMLRAYWKARPFASLAIDLDRKPVALEIGQPAAGIGMDDLFVFDTALSLRGLWDLMRYKGEGGRVTLEQTLAVREQLEAERPAAVRGAAWNALVRDGLLVEAEALPLDAKIITSPTPTDRESRYDAGSNNASTASGRSCVEPGEQPLTFKFDVEQAGDYAVSLRYCLERRMIPLWPQNSAAKTPWTENGTDVEVRVDGKLLSAETLYPTGTFNGHRGDVEMWCWHTVNSGRRLQLATGEHKVSVSFVKGLGHPVYDALLVSRNTGPAPPYPRWVDLYRVPPAWWVLDQTTRSSAGKRRDTYTVSLRNRCDEPCSYEIIAGAEKLKRQQVSANVDRIQLQPFEEKTFQVTFESPAGLTNNSEWANIYLWHEDVSLRQKYRLWNLIPPAAATSQSHPVLVAAPDPKKQAQLREWLAKRNPDEFTKALQEWTRGRNTAVGAGLGHIRFLPASLSDKRLAALDAWMSLGHAEIEQFLPDGPAEFQGYGTGWERTGVEYAGVWHKMPKVRSISPPGDIDNVTSLTVEAPPQKGKAEPYQKTYRADTDLDLISCVRDTRWHSMLGSRHNGAAPVTDSPLGRTHHTGIPLLAEAYYLTGDKKYAGKAFEMLHVFARKYTGLTKHFNFQLNREDRDWWGGRFGGPYLAKFGPRSYQSMGVYVLDLIWDALTPAERTLIEHNVLRWGMYEGMSGPLFEEPEYFAAVNREDMPFLSLGRVLGDPAPRDGLSFFYDIYKDIVLPDGIHQCSIGSYGGVGSYITFLQKLHSLGLDVSGDVSLRAAFSGHSSFIFSGGGVPNIDDGGGVSLHGLGAGFGCPSAEQYAWARQMFPDPELEVWPDLIAAAQRVVNSPLELKAERMREAYLDSGLPVEKLWPDLYIAPVKGMAMLRNRSAPEPIDWPEVIFDYGLNGGRSHAHPARLATIPSFNGQIVSMEYGYGLHGSPVAEGFHMRSYGHNVVVADGKDQYCPAGAVPLGYLRGSYSDPAVQWADAESTRIYNGIEMRRTVFTTDFGIVDLHLCNSANPHQYDWMFHSFGVAQDRELQTVAVERLAESGPLTFAVDPRVETTSKSIQVTWQNSPRTKPARKESTALLHENASVRVWSLPATDTTVALFGIPMIEDVGSEIDYLMLRRNTPSTVFATVQEPWRESSGPRLSRVERLHVTSASRSVADHEAFALEVTRSGGGRTRFFVNYTPGLKTIGRVMTDADVATWEISGDGVISRWHYTKGKRFTSK